IYLVSGHLEVKGGKSFQAALRPNDFLYIPPEKAFTLTNNSEQSASFLVILPKSEEISSNLSRLPQFLHGHYADIDATPVSKFGSTHTTIRILIKEDQAHQMIMRRFEIAPGGTIGIHNHEWEHEMFVLDGKMSLTNADGVGAEVQAGDFIYMPSDEKHGYINASTQRVIFLCMIPNLKFL
ncbi:MAG: cupin domain-containing protein, partial [Candidatus Heimdallarchaeota archaeon]|nr:cupin domain-containing protein [Candidatus Heimdallarchaeota archaeon]